MSAGAGHVATVGTGTEDDDTLPDINPTGISTVFEHAVSMVDAQDDVVRKVVTLSNGTVFDDVSLTRGTSVET